MTRKDFEIVAAAIRLAHNDANTVAEHEGIDLATARLVDAFEAINPRFDASRFEAAAGFHSVNA